MSNGTRKLQSLTSKQVYQCFKDDIFECPTGKKRLMSVYNFSEAELKFVFSIPFTCTISSQLRSFQLKILHNLIYLNNFLYRKTDFCPSPLCSFCGVENETVEHIFFDCQIVKTFLSALGDWLDFLALATLTKRTMLYGIVSDSKNRLLNFVILIAKYFILMCRKKSIKPHLPNFKAILKQYHDIELVIAERNGKKSQHFQKWEKSMRDKLEDL